MCKGVLTLMNKEITIKEFNLLTEDEKINLMKELHEVDESKKIIELLTAYPLKELSINLQNYLAVAYIIVDSSDKAMEVMNLIPEPERDAKWYYRYGYSLLYKDFPIASDQHEEVLALIDKACEMSLDDEVKDWCLELISYDPELEDIIKSKETSFSHIYDYYIHSDYANEEGSASEEEVAGTFCGSVLLSEGEWDKEKLISDLKVDWGIELSKEDTEDEDTIVTDLDECRVVISKFPAPVPNEEAEINAENNWMWEEAVEVTKTHKAHIVVAILGDEEDVISRGILYAKIMATCCKQETAIGVFTCGVVFEPSYYMKSAEMIRDGELPIFTWVWFGLYRTENGLSTYTYGMKDFGKLELEILDADEDAGKLLSFISAIASYILQDDVKLKDGETIGLSEDDIHQITLSKGVALPEKTLKISYEKKKSLGGKDTEEIKIEKRENMKKINHEFFGELDLKNGLDDGFGFSDGVIVLWEEEVNGINTTLWYAKSINITTEMLDVFSNFLTNFDNNDEIARKALEAYLLEDSEYIDFHREDIELDLPEDVKEFVQYMKVTNIGFWADGENIIIVDYMISPEESDEILAVKFNSNFEIMNISWES